MGKVLIYVDKNGANSFEKMVDEVATGANAGRVYEISTVSNVFAELKNEYRQAKKDN